MKSMTKRQEVFQTEGRDLLEKLWSWMAESNHKICSLQSELSDMREEKSFFLETIDDLNGEIRQLKAKLHALPESGQDLSMDIQEYDMSDEQDKKRPKISNNDDGREVTTEYETIKKQSKYSLSENDPFTDWTSFKSDDLDDEGVETDRLDVESLKNEPPRNQMEDTTLFPLLTPQKTPKPKTPRVNLSIGEKRELITKYDNLPKMSRQAAAKMLKIPRQTLRNILSKRDAITSAPKSDIKRMGRVGKGALVEDSLIQWLDTAREKNAIIPTHRMLRAKADELAKELGHDEFNASSGWLSRLLKRRDISHKKLQE